MVVNILLLFSPIILAGHLGQHTQMVALLINLLIVAFYSSSIEVLGQRAIKQSATLRTSFHLHHLNEGKGYSKYISNVHWIVLSTHNDKVKTCWFKLR